MAASPPLYGSPELENASLCITDNVCIWHARPFTGWRSNSRNVKDPNGAALAGAAVTVINSASRAKREKANAEHHVDLTGCARSEDKFGAGVYAPMALTIVAVTTTTLSLLVSRRFKIELRSALIQFVDLCEAGDYLIFGLGIYDPFHGY